MKKKKWSDKLRDSPINYFSDLFIIAMVMLWIIDNLYQSVIATIVTVSSIILSFESGMTSIDTTMWSSIGTNVAIPLSCGGAIWMIKNSIQHALKNKKGVDVPPDFPAVHPEGEYEEIELEEKEENIND